VENEVLMRNIQETLQKSTAVMTQNGLGKEMVQKNLNEEGQQIIFFSFRLHLLLLKDLP